MKYSPKKIRTFIGSKNYEESRSFYKDLEFEEVVIGNKMCLFKVNDDLGFYLQDYYVKKWVNNSMVFLEVDDLDKCWIDIHDKKLAQKYKFVRISEIKSFDWGREFYMHDPSGILWHFGQFNQSN